MPLRARADESCELRKLELFADMQDVHFDSLMRRAYVQNFPPGIDLIAEGDPSDFLHVLLDGGAELYATWNGRETSMAIVRPVSTFILAATARDAPYLMSARTLQKSRIMLLPSVDVREIFDSDPAFSRSIVRELAQCYRSVVKNTKTLKLRTGTERLANYLIRQYRNAGDAGFDLPIEKRRLASYLGMTPENLSRAIKALQPYGVTVRGSHVEIADDTDLSRLAKPTELIDDFTF